MPAAHNERSGCWTVTWSTRHCWQPEMFRNYAMAALRNLARNRLYAGINIGGLAVGFAAAIMIGLFVRDEFSYDGFMPGHQHVYRVSSFRIVPGRTPIFVPVVPPDLAAWMKLDFPAVQSAARLASEPVGLRHGNFE